MRDIIIDTDIGIDCDDALAVAAAVALERQGKIRTVGVSVCTARDGAAAAVAAIGRQWGKALDVSRYGGKTLDCDRVNVYASALRDRFGAVDPPDCGVRFLRKKLAAAQGKVTIASIGPMSNIAALLESGGDDISPLDGVSLAAQKVEAMYAMAGNFTHVNGGNGIAEWNVVQDVAGAKTVADRFPVDIVFVPYEVGHAVLSGSVFAPDDPAGMALRLFFAANPHEFNGTYARCSWDPITVCAAAGEDLFDMSEYGTVTVDDGGVTNFRKGAGRHRYLVAREPFDVTAAKLDALYATLL